MMNVYCKRYKSDYFLNHFDMSQHMKSPIFGKTAQQLPGLNPVMGQTQSWQGYFKLRSKLFLIKVRIVALIPIINTLIIMIIIIME